MFANNGEVGCSGSLVVETFDLLLPPFTALGGLATINVSTCGFTDVVVVVGANAAGPRYVGVWALLGAAVKCTGLLERLRRACSSCFLIMFENKGDVRCCSTSSVEAPGDGESVIAADCVVVFGAAIAGLCTTAGGITTTLGGALARLASEGAIVVGEAWICPSTREIFSSKDSICPNNYPLAWNKVRVFGDKSSLFGLCC